MEYYNDGKHLINEKKWLDAKNEFLKYRNYVQQGTPVSVKDGDGGVKPPNEDSHLKYLMYITEQLNALEMDPILSKKKK